MVRLPQNKKQTHWLNSRPQMWPSDLHWPWPWPWIFKVKYEICYISTKSGPIATKRKANISIELQASNVTNRFELGHDLDIRIFKVKCDLDHLVTKVRCKDLPDSDQGDSRCRRAIDSSSRVSVQNWSAFRPCWPNFGPLVAKKWLKMVASDHHLKKYLCNPIQTWCVHLLGECSELIRFWDRLAKFWPSSGQKVTENIGFWPLSEKVFSQSNSNLLCTFIWWVFRIRQSKGGGGGVGWGGGWSIFSSRDLHTPQWHSN